MNSVVTPSSGVTKTAVARINCDASASIISQSGAWVSSVGNIASRICTITLAANTFSETPYCLVNDATSGGGNNTILDGVGISSTSVQISCDNHDATDCTSFDVTLMCTGAP